MKKKRIINSIIGTILIFGISILIASFGSPQAMKPSMKVKKVLAPITTTDTVSVQKKTKRVEQEANITDELPENPDDYKTSYWIGSVPELLKDSIHTAGLVFIDSTAFSKVVPANIQEVYINADGVPSIARFVDSPFFKSMMQNKIRAIIYNNKANDKDEQLILALGGVNAFNADFIMIVNKERGLSIIPVGNETMQYKPKRLSVFQASNFEVTPINNEKNPNARVAAACYDQPHLYYQKHFGYNRLPKKIEKAKLGWKTHRYLHGASAKVLCTKIDLERVEKKIKSIIVEKGQTTIHVIAGQGAVTLRENMISCATRTVTQTWNWQVSLALGISKGFELAEGIGASFTTKVKGFYGQSQSNGYSTTTCFTTGKTYYTNPCAYACCDSQLRLDILQDDYEIRAVPVGSVWINYYKYATSLPKANAGKWSKLSQPVTLRFKYFPTSPLYGSWKETTEMYVDATIIKDDRNCNSYSCYGYTTNNCDQTVK